MIPRSSALNRPLIASVGFKMYSIQPEPFAASPFHHRRRTYANALSDADRNLSDPFAGSCSITELPSIAKALKIANKPRASPSPTPSPLDPQKAADCKRVIQGPVPESSNHGGQGDALSSGCPPMARKIRIEYAGSAYHVMARGNQGRDIYADDRDRGRRITGDAGHWPAGKGQPVDRNSSWGP